MIRARALLLLTLIVAFFAEGHESAVGTNLPWGGGALEGMLTAGELTRRGHSPDRRL